MNPVAPSLKDQGIDFVVDDAPLYRSVLLALDASDHANHGVDAASAIAALDECAVVTGAHVYAAKLHDLRFRQMEGGLPEAYRDERELERQRDVHDDLISRGLSVITDSYLDRARHSCEARYVSFAGKSLEGKNYRALAQETNSGAYDLLVIGAQGLGAIDGSRLGTVCNRVVRRSSIDTLVIRDPDRDLCSGPIVAAIDGSPKAFGALRTAMRFASSWDVPLHVVAAFDPYFHYVAFNRVAGVLSEEANKVFRFKEQEKLHEEIIDSGLAKIYQSHLDVAQSIAADHGLEIHTCLLDGKAHDAVERYVQEARPSLLAIGKLGIHADEGLDIGGNAENLLRNVDCSLLLSQKEFRPGTELLAEASTSWTHEAEQRLARAPEFVQGMARIAILRYAQQRGHTVVTERIVEEATAQLMPAGPIAVGEIGAGLDDDERSPDNAGSGVEWTPEATAVLGGIEDPALRNDIKMRAEKKARTSGAAAVDPAHVRRFTDTSAGAPRVPETHAESLHWHAAALARLAKAPEGFMRDKARECIETYAHANGLSEISLDVAEAGLATGRKAMQSDRDRGDDMRNDGESGISKCPFAGRQTTVEDERTVVSWHDDAQRELSSVPSGYCREMMIAAAETIAAKRNLDEIDRGFIKKIMATFAAGSAAVTETLRWDAGARDRISGAPGVIRGMLIREIEAWANREGMTVVTEAIVDAVRDEWKGRGVFHLDPEDPRGDGSAA